MEEDEEEFDLGNDEEYLHTVSGNNPLDLINAVVDISNWSSAYLSYRQFVSSHVIHYFFSLCPRAPCSIASSSNVGWDWIS